MRDELWVYCAHCSVNNEIQPVEWGATPTSIEFPPERAGRAVRPPRLQGRRRRSRPPRTSGSARSPPPPSGDGVSRRGRARPSSSGTAGPSPAADPAVIHGSQHLPWPGRPTPQRDVEGEPGRGLESVDQLAQRDRAVAPRAVGRAGRRCGRREQRADGVVDVDEVDELGAVGHLERWCPRRRRGAGTGSAWAGCRRVRRCP